MISVSKQPAQKHQNQPLPVGGVTLPSEIAVGETAGEEEAKPEADDRKELDGFDIASVVAALPNVKPPPEEIPVLDAT